MAKVDTSSGTDRVKMALLLDCYGKILTEKQFAAMDFYFQDDLSLSEISEQTGITRQGVWDNIKRGEKLLLNMEEQLGVVAKTTDTNDKIRRAAESLKEIKDYAQRKYLPAEIIKDLTAILADFDSILKD